VDLDPLAGGIDPTEIHTQNLEVVGGGGNDAGRMKGDRGQEGEVR